MEYVYELYTYFIQRHVTANGYTLDLDMSEWKIILLDKSFWTKD